jgi:glucans biosynthesis protein
MNLHVFWAFFHRLVQVYQVVWTRRQAMVGIAATLLPLATGWKGLTQEVVRDAGSDSFGPPTPFDPSYVRRLARELAGKPFRAPVQRHAEILSKIGYDAHNQIIMRREHALWRDQGPIAADFFHQGNLFRQPVVIHAVEGEEAREVLYRKDVFSFGKDVPFASEIPDRLGFAGFRLRNDRTWEEWLSFLGASYFRSPGASGQFGLSGRGIAVNTASPDGEEFPAFTQFWLERPTDGDQAVLFHALLEGPSVTGAYRFDARYANSVVMDVAANLFPRRSIEHLGIAPLTSMYWFGAHDRGRRSDWRPEVHDSDGLEIVTGAGETIWRPLNNPIRTRISSFMDVNPRGFGLVQRERRFDRYEDTYARYDLRPSLWVEPKGAWGKGHVKLIEMPTNGEFNDNIVALWESETPAAAGEEINMSYRLTWADARPFNSPLARVVATRTGTAGVLHRGFTKIVVDFAGSILSDLDKTPEANEKEVEFAISAPRGEILRAHVLKVLNRDRWRGVFEFKNSDDQPVDIRGFLRLGERALSETWLYQYLTTNVGP